MRLVALSLFLVPFAVACAAPTEARDARGALDPSATEPAGLEQVGDAAASMGDMTRAEEYFAAALRRGGEDQRLTRKLVAACVADNRFPLARAHAAEYVRRHPTDTRMRYVLASLELASGRRDRAIAEYTRVVEEKPDLAAAHYALATLLDDDDAAARREYRAYLALSPRGEFAEVARVALGGAVPARAKEAP